MGNVWGTANPIPLAGLFTAGGDVAVTAGAETTIITTGAIAANAPGNYYPVIWLSAAMTFGSPAPTALTFAFKLGAGADVDSQAVAALTLSAGATFTYGFVLVGANSGTAWLGAGSIINITALAVTNAATFRFAGSRAVVALFRGIDA